MDHKQYIPVAYKTGYTTGTTITSSSASQSIAIPTLADGTTNAKRCVFSCVSGNVHIKLGTGTVTAAAGDLLVGITPIVLDTAGVDNIGILQETAGSKVNICPVEQ